MVIATFYSILQENVGQTTCYCSPRTGGFLSRKYSYSNGTIAGSHFAQVLRAINLGQNADPKRFEQNMQKGGTDLGHIWPKTMWARKLHKFGPQMNQVYQENQKKIEKDT